MSIQKNWRETIKRALGPPVPSSPNNSLASECKERAETLELKLEQLLEAQCLLSEQLAAKLNSQISLQVKKALITDLQKEFAAAWGELSTAMKDLEEKIIELQGMTVKYKNAEASKKGLEDFWLYLLKKNEIDLNEAYACHYSPEVNIGCFTGATIPSAHKHKIPAHQGGCTSLLFEPNNVSRLITGGSDGKIKIWDTNTGMLTKTLSVSGDLTTGFDLTITHDNTYVIAAGKSGQMCVWETSSGHMCDSLFGHIGEVYAVDASPVESRLVASAGSDRTMKIWDLPGRCCINTIRFKSSAAALCFSRDGKTVCSGHINGNICLWDVATGNPVKEVVDAHSRSLTSVSISGNGNLLLASRMDNVHKLFDLRSMELCGTLRDDRCTPASIWSRSCLSPDEKYVAAGSDDGSVYLWSISKAGGILKENKASNILKEHRAPVLCCSWSGLGKPLASADKDGMVCIWE